jgi:hypothetical protein
MARSEKKILKTQPLTVSTNQIESFDITNFSGVAVTVISPAGAVGTLKVQYSNINSPNLADWTDIPSATIAVVASGGVTLDISNTHAGFVKAVITLSAGAGNYDIYYLAKDF